MTNKQLLDLKEYYSKPIDVKVNDYMIQTVPSSRKFYVFVRDPRLNKGAELDIKASSHYEAWQIFKELLDNTLFV